QQRWRRERGAQRAHASINVAVARLALRSPADADLAHQPRQPAPYLAANARNLTLGWTPMTYPCGATACLPLSPTPRYEPRTEGLKPSADAAVRGCRPSRCGQYRGGRRDIPDHPKA